MSDALLKVLNLRPTNAALRLGPSWLPVLNPRDLVRALSPSGTALLCAPMFSRAAIDGILGAARHLDAVLGVSIPFPLGERDRPELFVDELKKSCEQITHSRPVFLQGGPFRMRTADDRSSETMAAQVFKYLEAGCSLICLDASSLDVRSAAKSYGVVGQAAAERELSIEVAALKDGAGGMLVEDTRKMLQALRASGMSPRFVRVEASALVYENELRAERVREALEVARECEAELCIEDTIGLSLEVTRMCSFEGVRKWEASELFARRVLPALPTGATDALHARAAATNRHWTELLGALSEGIATPEEPVRLKLEAMAYEEASSLLTALGAKGSATRATTFLVEHAGY